MLLFYMLLQIAVIRVYLFFFLKTYCLASFQGTNVKCYFNHRRLWLQEIEKYQF
jgi:hypothetical protein